MDARSLLAALLLIAVLGVAGYVLWDPSSEPLVALPEAPRDPVAADTSAPKPSLLGLCGVDAPANDEAARRIRNRVAHRWIAALEALKAGQTSQGEVERLEMELWVQRHLTGEVTAKAMHEALAALFERELARRKTMLETGFASPDDVHHAQVLLARERYAAGDAKSDYPVQRTAYLEARRKHLRRLADSGVMVKDVALVEIEALEAELPEPETLRPKPAKSS